MLQRASRKLLRVMTAVGGPDVSEEEGSELLSLV